jgi:hypothetical protein
MVAGAELDLGKEGREPSAGERGGGSYTRRLRWGQELAQAVHAGEAVVLQAACDELTLMRWE